jgi:hypothetical protein
MGSRIKIIEWLSLLLLSAGIAARSQLAAHRSCFRRADDPGLCFEKIKINNIQGTRNLKRITMKIRIRLLHWLNLLQLSACAGWQSDRLSHFALFRRT